MELGNEGLAEQEILNRLTNILPDEGYSLGQSKEPEASDEAKPEAGAAEAKTDKSDDVKPDEQKSDAPTDNNYEEIEIKGEKYQVPKAIKDSIMLQADYTRKTMELAEQRKALEKADPKIVDEYKQRLTHYETLLGQAVAQDQKVDWVKLLETDPIEYLRQKELSESRAREWQQVSERNQKENAEKQSQALGREWEQLIAKRPDLNNEAAFKAHDEKVRAYLSKRGYDNQAVNNALFNHDVRLMIEDLVAYEALKASKAEVVKKIEKLPPKIERPGVHASEGQANQAAMQRLRKTGSLDDASAALRSLMG